MSYLSGIMLGASIANYIRQAIGGGAGSSVPASLRMRPARGAAKNAAQGGQGASKTSCATEVPPFTCAHVSSGRRRYRTPYLTEAFATLLEERLAQLPFVSEVRANAVSGSILLVYQPEDEAHILVLAEGLSAIFSEGRNVSHVGTLAQSMRRSVYALSSWIQQHTGGALDLSSLVAGIFVLRGVRQLVLSNTAPSGSQMLWWALTLMRGWRV